MVTDGGRSEDLQLQLVTLEQFLHHLKEALHKQVERIVVTRDQQLVQGVHRDLHHPESGRYHCLVGDDKITNPLMIRLFKD